jgi:hypothetical protein
MKNRKLQTENFQKIQMKLLVVRLQLMCYIFFVGDIRKHECMPPTRYFSVVCCLFP